MSDVAAPFILVVAFVASSAALAGIAIVSSRGQSRVIAMDTARRAASSASLPVGMPLGLAAPPTAVQQKVMSRCLSKVGLGARASAYQATRGPDGLWYLVYRQGARDARVRVEWLARLNRDMATLAARASGVGVDGVASARLRALFEQQRRDGVSRIHDKPHTSNGTYGSSSWDLDDFACAFVEMVDFSTYAGRPRPPAGADNEYYNLIRLLTVHELTHIAWRHGAHDAYFWAKMDVLKTAARRSGVLV